MKSYDTALIVSGLVIDIVGVVMLFFYGLPPKMKPPKKWVGAGIYFAEPYSMIFTGMGSEVEPDEEHRKWMRRWKARCLTFSRVALFADYLGVRSPDSRCPNWPMNILKVDILTIFSYYSSVA